MTDLIEETRSLALSYGLQFEDKGKGHVQIKGHGNLVNYWPLSKAKTIHSPTLNRKETHCTPWDAVKLCLGQAKAGMKPEAAKEVSKGRGEAKERKHKPTDPAGLKHFYGGSVPPWDDSLGTFQFNAPSDALRFEAYQLENAAIQKRAEADDLDDPEFMAQQAGEISILNEARARI